MSLPVSNRVVKVDLSNFHCESILLQYVDDILICSPTEQQCRKDTIPLLTLLADRGYKVDKAKVQYCQEEIHYLGQLLSASERRVTPDRVESV